MRFQIFIASILVAICSLGLNGCWDKQTSGPAASGSAAEEHAQDEEGPHGGHIIELGGSEEHHAELTHDEATHKVGIYLLGGDAKTSAPIETKDPVIISVLADGETSQYTLPAAPQAGEADGMSSYFEIESEPLCDIVCGESEAKSTVARVSLTIDGKPYVGLIETSPHDHDHGHEH